mgnify:CR=1 FL=1
MEKSKSIISVQGVSKDFGHERVLHNITRDFARGKIHGIVGNNGSGKTVLMKCICGFLIPTEGKIFVHGKQVGREVDFPPGLGVIIETPGCDNDIQHLMLKCPVKPNISYSFRDDTLIMAFVRSGLGVTISQELVMQAFGCPGVVSRPLEPACCRTLGLAFSKTASSVVSRTLLDYLQNKMV